MSIKLRPNSCCPVCRAELEIDLGTGGSYFDPPEPPQICCTECDWSPDLVDIDWDDYDKPTLTAKQEARIERIRRRLFDYRTFLFLPENREICTFDDLFGCCPEGDFSCDGEPEDVGNAYTCGDEECDKHWHESCQVTEMGRKDGKTWFIVRLDSNAGDGDYQPDGGWDEREGDTITDSILRDLWFDYEGRSIDHFHGWALYDLDVAITGEDPLEKWMDASRITPDKAIASAMGNLKYLHRMVRRIKNKNK